MKSLTFFFGGLIIFLAALPLAPKVSADVLTYRDVCHAAAIGEVGLFSQIRWNWTLNSEAVDQAKSQGLAPEDCGAILNGMDPRASYLLNDQIKAQNVESEYLTYRDICHDAAIGVIRTPVPMGWKWTLNSEAVDQAKLQGLTPEDCGAILNGKNPWSQNTVDNHAVSADLAAKKAARLEREAGLAKARDKAAAEARARQARMEWFTSKEV